MELEVPTFGWAPSKDFFSLGTPKKCHFHRFLINRIIICSQTSLKSKAMLTAKISTVERTGSKNLSNFDNEENKGMRNNKIKATNISTSI